MASDTDNGTHFYSEISVLEKWVTDMQFFLSSDLNPLSACWVVSTAFILLKVEELMPILKEALATPKFTCAVCTPFICNNEIKSDVCKVPE